MLSVKPSQTFGDKLIPPLYIKYTNFRRMLSYQPYLRFRFLNKWLAHAQISLSFLRAVKDTIS